MSGRNQGDLQAAATDAQTLATNPEFAFLVVPGDVGVEVDIINLMFKSVEHFGRIDYAVNNGGVHIDIPRRPLACQQRE